MTGSRWGLEWRGASVRQGFPCTFNMSRSSVGSGGAISAENKCGTLWLMMSERYVQGQALFNSANGMPPLEDVKCWYFGQVRESRPRV